MRVEDIRRLIELVENSDVGELEVRRFWNSVRISKTRATDGQALMGESLVSAPAQPAAPVRPMPAVTSGKAGETASATVGGPASAPGASQAPEESEEGLVPIVSPMVGTFYQSPSPTAGAYVELGKRVEPGQVVCIIEAMKLMNEIEAEVSGTVIRALVKDEEPVEYNQPLFLVRPD